MVFAMPIDQEPDFDRAELRPAGTMRPGDFVVY